MLNAGQNAPKYQLMEGSLEFSEDVRIPLLFHPAVNSGEFCPSLRFRSCIIWFSKLPWRNGGSNTKSETRDMFYVLYKCPVPSIFQHICSLFDLIFFLFLLFLLKARVCVYTYVYVYVYTHTYTQMDTVWKQCVLTVFEDIVN